MERFWNLDQDGMIKKLYEEGLFVMSIRYYGYKVNLFLLSGSFVEVFYNHKLDCIEKIQELDQKHSRMNFYADQIKVEYSSLFA